ncbi:S41 family peptidase [Salinisphaera sp. Q1T1-3]|uniref:S41 family peptidase n=1 Tax=Salinisphaera sp. Q1T1-3 TaxID=2321229 RepID=UPI0013143A31|nr:S41 family peptidase [Salinisphaera sp. Q1T1-3]
MLREVIGAGLSAALLWGCVGATAVAAPADGSAAQARAPANQGYYREPSLWHDEIAFVAEGDIWLAGLNGRNVHRLTSTAGAEDTPFISPDGKQVAFVSDRDGPSEIYVMPRAGGLPKRVTFEQARVRLHGWLADGRLLYATSNTVGPSSQWQLRIVEPKTGTTHPVPLQDAIDGDFTPDGQTLVFTRFGLTLTGDNARLYRGGAMGQLWRYATNGQSEATRLPTQGSVSAPMIWRDRVVFLSDADGHPNLWSMKRDGSARRQLTHYTGFTPQSPSIAGDRVIYQLGADLVWLDLAQDQTHRIDLHLPSDFRHRQSRWIDDPMSDLDAVSLGGNGRRAVVTARGHVATIGTNAARIIDITPAGAPRLRAAVTGPKAQWIYAISDAAGSQEIWRFAADGTGHGKQLTHDGQGVRWSVHPSPDGRWLAHDDNQGNIWLYNLKSGTDKKIITGGTGGTAADAIRWSPNSAYLAVAWQPKGAARERIALYGVREDRAETVTTARYASFAPAFSSDGRWLYFLSDRRFVPTPASPWGDRNLGPAFDDRTQIYALALTTDTDFPFATPTELNPVDVEAASQADDDEDTASDAATDEDSASRTGDKSSPSGQMARSAGASSAPRVAWDGLSSRLWPVPVDAGDYHDLGVTDKALYVLADDPGHSDQSTDGQAATQLLTIKIAREDVQAKEYAPNVSAFTLSPNGQRLLLSRGSHGHDLLIVDAGSKLPDSLTTAHVRTGDWGFALDPVAEWHELFADSWLMHRAAFFDPKMRGTDWAAVRKRYGALIDRAADRRDVSDVLAQMKTQLAALHSQVYGGDVDTPDPAISGAGLGARLVQSDDGVRIDHIYRTDPDLPDDAAPLDRPGVDARAGDRIVAVNGHPVKKLGPLYRALRNQVGAQVLLTLARGGQTHRTVVSPVGLRREARLRYEDWVQANKTRVTKASDGRIGYVNLYAMGENDIASFVRDFKAQFEKPALIVDVRRNRGGNIDSWVLDQLMRRPWMFWKSRGAAPEVNMQQASRAHIVVLVDPVTYSDGETFAAGIKALGIAPLIGQRTAGAGVWLSDSHTLEDGGHARIAEFPQFEIGGRWLVEGHGISPDIEVVNAPHASYEGHDAQLAKAVSMLKQSLQTSPVKPLDAQPIPPLDAKQPFARPVKPLDHPARD